MKVPRNETSIGSFKRLGTEIGKFCIEDPHTARNSLVTVIVLVVAECSLNLPTNIYTVGAFMYLAFYDTSWVLQWVMGDIL